MSKSLALLTNLLIIFVIIWFIVTLFQTKSLNSQVEILSKSVQTVFGFTHGQCNYTTPSIPCDPNLTYLCEEQQKLFSCNSSGWSPFFDIAMAGGNSTSFSNLVTSFVQPACDTTKIITVRSTAWIAPGMVIYIQGGGYYIVSTVIDGTMVNVVNPCFINNTIPGLTVPSGGIVTPGGQQGPTGPPGPSGSESFQFGDCNYTIPNVTCSNIYLCLEQQVLYICNNSAWNIYFQLGAATPGVNAYSNTIGSFVQPNCYANVTILVQSSAWISKGMVLYIENGGYYIVQSVIPLIVSNPCFISNSIPGTIIGNYSLVSPGGQQGPTISSNSTVEVPTTIWGRSSDVGTNSLSSIESSAMSPDGNFIYVSGLAGYSDLILGNNVNINSSGFFIAKYDKLGTPQWAIGKNYSSIYFLNTDQNGFVYMGGQNIEKYDSSGNFLLGSVLITYNISGVYNIYPESIDIDLNGDVYMSGHFLRPTTLIPAVLIDFGNNVTLSITTLTAVRVPFLVKYNSLLVAQWIKSATGVGVTQMSYNNVKVKNGAVYTAGFFLGSSTYTIDFGNASFNGTGGSFPVVLKYNSSGSLIWLRIPKAFNIGALSSFIRTGMDVDENENIYFSFSGSTQTYDFGNNVIISLPYGATSCVIGKYNSSGDIQWASSVFGTIIPYVSYYTSIKVLNNNVYTVGYLGSVNLNVVLSNIFRFGINVMLTSTNMSPVIVKYDSNTGQAQWAKSIIYQNPATVAIYESLTGVNNTFYAAGYVQTLYYNNYDNYGNNVIVAGNAIGQNFILIKYQE